MSNTHRSMLYLSLLSGLLLAAPVSAEKFYKWTDADGQTHYSSKPPSGQPATVIRTDKQDSSAAVEALQSDQQRAAELAQQRADSKADAAAAAAREEEIDAQCQQARQNLDGLLTSTRVFSEAEDGSRQRLSEEQRQENINSSREFIRANCE